MYKFKVIELSMFDKNKSVDEILFRTAQDVADFLEVSRSTIFRMKKGKFSEWSKYKDKIRIENCREEEVTKI